MIRTLIHQTPFVQQILQDGRIRSAAEMGRTGTAGEDNSIVYFTATDNKGIPVPHFDKRNAAFHFDAQAVMKGFPTFFVNEGNAFGPLNGDVNRATKDCRCTNTYNSYGFGEGKCKHKTLQELEELLVYSFDHCDGGPELGIFKSIPLEEPYFMYVTVPKSTYEKIPDDVKARYGDKIKVSASGGRRKL